MSERSRPLSRRALVRSAAAAPLVAVAAQLREGSISLAEAADAYAKASDITDEEWTKLIQRGKKPDHYGPALPECKYKAVCAEVWSYVLVGTGGTAFDFGADVSPILKAYDYPAPGDIPGVPGQVSSGRAICRDLDCFDPTGEDPPTNACAYLVGFKAAQAANKDGRKITWADYTQAWYDVYKFVGRRNGKAKDCGLAAKRDQPVAAFGSGC